MSEPLKHLRQENTVPSPTPTGAPLGRPPARRWRGQRGTGPYPETLKIRQAVGGLLRDEGPATFRYLLNILNPTFADRRVLASRLASVLGNWAQQGVVAQDDDGHWYLT